MAEKSRRQRLLELAETGNLRSLVEHGDIEVEDLIVDIVLRYCESRRKGRVIP